MLRVLHVQQRVVLVRPQRVWLLRLHHKVLRVVLANALHRLPSAKTVPASASASPASPVTTAS